MAKYLAIQIKNNKLDYIEVVTRYPQHKEGIDAYFRSIHFNPIIKK